MTGLGDDSLAFDTQEFTQPDVTQELDVNQNSMFVLFQALYFISSEKLKPVKTASSSSNVVPGKLWVLEINEIKIIRKTTNPIEAQKELDQYAHPTQS